MGKFSLEETVKYNKSGPARYCCRTDVWKEAAMVLPSFGKRAVVSGGASSRPLRQRESSMWSMNSPARAAWVM